MNSEKMTTQEEEELAGMHLMLSNMRAELNELPRVLNEAVKEFSDLSEPASAAFVKGIGEISSLLRETADQIDAALARVKK